MSLILKTERIEVIDVLRGFALFGIILVHMVEQYYAGPMPESITKTVQSSIADNIFQGFVSIFIMGKFYMIFSFLFGISFSIQSAKGEDNSSFLFRFTWRLIILFLIGMLHHIHYRGDILGIYAILGLGLLMFFKASDKALLITGVLLVFNLPSLVIRITQGLITGDATLFPEGDQVGMLTYYNTVKSGAYLDILRLNLNDFPSKMIFQVLFGRIFITLGLFLLGYYAGRKNLFSDLAGKKVWIKKMIGYSWKTLIALVVFMGVFFGVPLLLKLEVPQFVQMAVGLFGYDIFNAALSLIYLAGIVLLFQKEKWRPRLMSFYEVGRMGLTTYLMQSFVGFMIFFSPGLGLLNELGAAVCFAMAIVLFVAQIAFSKLWLRYFNYGFFEWAWRSLTYLKWQPLLKEKNDLIPAN